MNRDYRVSTSLVHHPKAIKLMRRLGDRAFYNIVQLWSFVALNKPDGNLAGLNIEDIEIAAGWNGEVNIFAETLLDLGFLEKEGNNFAIHDWQEHNGFASHAKERSEKARKAAEKRWGKSNIKKQPMLNDASSNAKVCPEQCLEMLPYNAPSPNPTPSPNEFKKHSPPSGVGHVFDVEANFNEAWSNYPKKSGKKESLKHYRATVKDEKTAKLFMTALKNYKAHIEIEKIESRYVKSGSTFFNNWQDEAWSNPPTESMPDQFKGAI